MFQPEDQAVSEEFARQLQAALLNSTQGRHI
jgi:hypothetical protein